jgi:CheY-like chemotaxis protein
MNPENASPHRKVLIVDNDPVVVKAMAAKLHGAGYEALEASGAEAIALVHKEKPDLIVLDLNSPPDVCGVPGDGYHTMECLRGTKESRTVPIITITGIPDSLDMERNLDLGAVGFLFKPLNYDALLRLVRSALGATVRMAA